MNVNKIVYYVLFFLMVIFVITGNLLDNIALDRLGTIFMILICIMHLMFLGKKEA